METEFSVLNTLCSGSVDEKSLMEMVEHMPLPKETLLGSNPDMPMLINLLNKVGKLCVIPFSVFTIEKNVQTMKSSSLREVFTTMITHNTHTLRENGVDYICGWHKETVFQHSIMSMLISIQHFGKIDEHFAMLVAFTNLVHDIGKIECVETHNIGGKAFIGYPFHPELAAGFLMEIYNKEFCKIIPYNEWEAMCRAVNIHMNGYHLDDIENVQNRIKWYLFRLESHLTKMLLYHLSIGDTLGHLTYEHIVEDTKKFLESRKLIADFMTKDFSSVEFCELASVSKFIIVLRGMPCSGKTQLRLRIQNKLADLNIAYKIIERDDVMVAIAQKHATDNKVAVPTTYNECYTYVKDNKLGHSVNDHLHAQIAQAFTDGRVVLLDTVMSYFATVEQIIPNTNEIFAITIDVIRNTPFTVFREGKDMTVETQVQLHGERSLLRWIPSVENLILKFLSSKCSYETLEGTRYGQRSKIQPFITFQYCWNETFNMGFDSINDQLTELFRQGIPTPDTEINIVAYFNKLYAKYGLESSMNLIRTSKIVVKKVSQLHGTPYDNRVVIIRYLEGCDFWKAKWARQSRGIVLFQLEENKPTFVNIKCLLQRGAEILTKLHTEQGIYETQDLDTSHASIFDARQTKVIDALASRKEINGYLTSKCDGSLLGVSLYSGKMKDIMTTFILTYGNDMAKLCVKMAQRLNLPFVPLLSTQNTLFIPSIMTTYTVSSILHLDEPTTEEPLKIFEEKSVSFFRDIEMIWTEFSKTHHEDVITISFETVCKNRTTAWNETHRELAVSYPLSMVKFLGIAFGTTDVQFIPHFMISDVVRNTSFDEPIWWHITHSKQIEQMLTDLSKCIRNTLTREEFIVLHPHGNKKVKHLMFDHEGFVFYADIDGVLDYSKVKTTEYYMSHKFRIQNIKYLMELAKTACDIFPLCRSTSDFFGNLEKNLLRVHNAFNNLTSNLSEVLALLDEKQKKAFDRLNTTNRPRSMAMLLNISEMFKEKIFEMFKDVFGISKQDDLDVVKCLVGFLLTELQPWLDDPQKRIDEIVKTVSEGAQMLFSLTQTQTSPPEELDV